MTKIFPITFKIKMKDEEIIKAAIAKAVKNGWEDGQYIHLEVYDDDRWIFYGDDGDVPLEVIIDGIITSIDFVKALWGEEEIQVLDTTPLELVEITPGQMCQLQFNKSQFMPLYQWHLQNLVVATNRLEYIKQFGGIDA